MQLRTAFEVLHVFFSLGRHADYNLFPCEKAFKLLWSLFVIFPKKPSMQDVPRFQMAFFSRLIFYKVKKESTIGSSNKRTKTFYRDYLHIVNFCAILSKEIISTN